MAGVRKRPTTAFPRRLRLGNAVVFDGRPASAATDRIESAETAGCGEEPRQTALVLGSPLWLAKILLSCRCLPGFLAIWDRKACRIAARCWRVQADLAEIRPPGLGGGILPPQPGSRPEQSGRWTDLKKVPVGGVSGRVRARRALDRRTCADRRRRRRPELDGVPRGRSGHSAAPALKDIGRRTSRAAAHPAPP